MAKARYGSPAVFVNKVLLECNDSHLFTYCLPLLLFYNSRVEKLWHKTSATQNLKYLISGFLQKKVAGSSPQVSNFSEWQNHQEKLKQVWPHQYMKFNTSRVRPENLHFWQAPGDADSTSSRTSALWGGWTRRGREHSSLNNEWILPTW